MKSWREAKEDIIREKITRLFCAKCKDECNVLNLFEGQYVCMECYKKLKQKRDFVYYKNLWDLGNPGGK